MEKYRHCLVEYIPSPGKNPSEVRKPNCVETHLVLCAHDEMMSQANDGKAKSWVLDSAHAMKKKGMGHGIHQSDVICSTVGWLKEASQSMEYRKNYDGYWNRKMFVKQVQLFLIFTIVFDTEHWQQLREKIIPAFERAYSPGHQVLIMVDNSQGHSAYAVDALLTSRMNLRPGGKQA